VGAKAGVGGERHGEGRFILTFVEKEERGKKIPREKRLDSSLVLRR